MLFDIPHNHQKPEEDAEEVYFTLSQNNWLEEVTRWQITVHRTASSLKICAYMSTRILTVIFKPARVDTKGCKSFFILILPDKQDKQLSQQTKS